MRSSFVLPQLMRLVFAALLLAGAARDDTEAQSVPGPRAATVDVSGAELFWRVIDAVSSGAITADSGRAWLATHPGYQQIQRNGTRLPVIQHCLRRMAPGARPDTFTVPASARAFLYPYVCDHLDSARAHRQALERFAASLRDDADERARIAAALDTARAYLPAAAREFATPTVYGLIFEPGGFGGETIATDLLHFMRRGAGDRARFLGHELHHAMMVRLPSDLREADASVTRPMMLTWLTRTQWEGIASLIDKRGYVRLTPSGLVPSDAAATGFPREHAERMQAGREALAAVETAVLRRVRGEGTDAELASALQASIPDGAHALGQYMALAIEVAEGRAAIVEATRSRFGFVRAYQRAALSRPAQFRPFDAAVMSYVDELARAWAPRV
jgi:hypothetical protein